MHLTKLTNLREYILNSLWELEYAIPLYCKHPYWHQADLATRNLGMTISDSQYLIQISLNATN